MVQVNNQLRLSTSYVTLTPTQIRAMLADALCALGMDPAVITGRDAALAGLKLSAAVNKAPPWGRSYVLAVLHGSQTVQPSQLFIQAILSLGAMIDGVPALVASSHEVRVLAAGEVVPGSVVLANSKACIRPGCPVQFVPDHPSRKYCCKECRNKDRSRRK